MRLGGGGGRLAAGDQFKLAQALARSQPNLSLSTRSSSQQKTSLLTLSIDSICLGTPVFFLVFVLKKNI